MMDAVLTKRRATKRTYFLDSNPNQPTHPLDGKGCVRASQAIRVACAQCESTGQD